jgi:hypothetical protein
MKHSLRIVNNSSIDFISFQNWPGTWNRKGAECRPQIAPPHGPQNAGAGSGLKPLHRCPSLDQCPVTEKCSSESSGATALSARSAARNWRAMSVVSRRSRFFAEHRRHPDRIVDAEPHEPAEQEIVLHLLHQLALRPDREQNLDQRCPQQPLRRDRGPSFGGVERGKHAIEPGPTRR